MHTENNSQCAENNWWFKGKLESQTGKNILSLVTITKEFSAIFTFVV